jgi:hypothetical protein
MIEGLVLLIAGCFLIGGVVGFLMAIREEDTARDFLVSFSTWTLIVSGLVFSLVVVAVGIFVISVGVVMVLSG